MGVSTFLDCRKVNAIQSLRIMTPIERNFPSYPPECPLRLAVAAKVAFPDGSMSASGLRREAHRGRLVVERIAGKDYTTLANIERMRELCRVQAKAPGCGSGQLAGKIGASSPTLSGLSSTAAGTSPQDALKTKLVKLRKS
jgi:hypothetical protein